MATLYVDRKGAEIDAEADTIVVRSDGERRGTVPLRTLERVVVRGTARLSTRLIARLMDHGVSLMIMAGRKGLPAATFAAASAPDAGLRVAQYRLAMDETARSVLSGQLVAAKLRAHKRVLAEAGASQPRRQGRAIRDAIAALDTGLGRIEQAEPPPSRASLRGIEGAAAAAYFKALGAFFPQALGFEGRNRRPPRDPVNACLSLGYTLLHADALRAIAMVGLDPMIGIYHELKPGRESLACDLAEPARPLVDRFVLGLFDDAVLRPEDFRNDKGGCLLNKRGRQDFYRAYEDSAPLQRRILGRIARRLVAELRAREQASGLALPPPAGGGPDDET